MFLREELPSQGFLKFPVIQSARARLLEDLQAQAKPVMYDVSIQVLGCRISLLFPFKV
jgi:hypothetical protein